MKTEPKRTTQSYEIQLDGKLGTMKRKTTELQELMELFASNGNNGDMQHLQTLDDKTQEIQTLCDQIDALITHVQREASTRVETLNRKIATIERTKEVIEETIYENEDEYANKTTGMEGKIEDLLKQLSSARADGDTKQDVVIQLEHELQQKEATLATWQAEIENFSNERYFETKKLESLLVEKEDELEKARQTIESLQKKGTLVSTKRKETKQVQDASVSPFKFNQSSPTKSLPTKKSPISRRIKSVSRPVRPIKLELSDIETSSDEYESAEDVPKATRAHITQMGGQDETMNQSNSATKSSFTATPSKFGMKSWDPKDCGFMEHLIRLEMGLKQSENKGCDLDTRENLILMTLPAEFSYVNEYVKGSRTTMEDFKKKLVELIIGSNTDQTQHLMQCQRKVGEHILSYLNRLQNIYSYCSNKSESEMENDSWGVRIVYQKIVGAMGEAAKLELQRQVEDKVEQGNLTFSALKDAVVKAARKSGKPMSEYISVNQINQSNTSPMVMNHPPKHFPPQPMAPQPVPNYMMNQIGHAEYNNRNNRRVYQERNSGQENDSANRGQRNDDWKRNSKCFYCGIMGHVKADCRRRKADEQRQGYNNNSWKKGYDGAKKEDNARENKDKPGSSDRRNNSRWKGKPKN